MSKAEIKALSEGENGGVVGFDPTIARPLSPERAKVIADFEHEAEEALIAPAHEGDPSYWAVVPPAYKISHAAEDAWFPAKRTWWQRLTRRG